jgi:hypothetical protein
VTSQLSSMERGRAGQLVTASTLVMVHASGRVGEHQADGIAKVEHSESWHAWCMIRPADQDYVRLMVDGVMEEHKAVLCTKEESRGKNQRLTGRRMARVIDIFVPDIVEGLVGSW